MLRNIRPGQWAVKGKQIGIINEFNTNRVDVVKGGVFKRVIPAESADFHSVDENGETVEEKFVPISSLRDAFVEEIPEARLKDKEVKLALRKDALKLKYDLKGK